MKAFLFSLRSVPVIELGFSVSNISGLRKEGYSTREVIVTKIGFSQRTSTCDRYLWTHSFCILMFLSFLRYYHVYVFFLYTIDSFSNRQDKISGGALKLYFKEVSFFLFVILKEEM